MALHLKPPATTWVKADHPPDDDCDDVFIWGEGLAAPVLACWVTDSEGGGEWSANNSFEDLSGVTHWLEVHAPTYDLLARSDGAGWVMV